MSSTKKLFHGISYLQYPLMLCAVLYYFIFIYSLLKKELDWEMLNYALLLFGVALSMSTLQDTSKTQNKLSKKVWESPKNGKLMLYLIATAAFGLIFSGLFLFYFASNETADNLALGITVLGIGLIGILKSAIEMFENHRLDKKLG